jgi:hypothetical protein
LRPEKDYFFGLKALSPKGCVVTSRFAHNHCHVEDEQTDTSVQSLSSSADDGSGAAEAPPTAELTRTLSGAWLEVAIKWPRVAIDNFNSRELTSSIEDALLREVS